MTNSQILRMLNKPATLRETIDWKDFPGTGREGVKIHWLYDDRGESNEGPAAALLWYAKGAKVLRHLHPGYELIYVLDGVLSNDAGDHGPGTLEVCPPGSTHSLESKDGCIFLVVWEQPVVVQREVA